MELVAATLSMVMAMLVALSGEARPVKLWFSALCASATLLCVALWVETNQPEHAFLAARVVMTAAMLLSSFGVLSARVMCRLRIHRPVLLLLGAAMVVNVTLGTATDLYFSGEYYQFSWGGFVAGRPEFLAAPVLTSAIVLYGLSIIAASYRTAHPLDKNRVKYMMLAYFILSFALFDYLLHFGWDLFGGALTPIVVPIFLALFGYACMRYRVVDFRAMVGRASSLLLTTLIVTAAYFLVLEGARRWMSLPSGVVHGTATGMAVLLFTQLKTRMPRWIELVVGPFEEDFSPIIDRFSDELMSTLDESVVVRRWSEICVSSFDSTSAVLLGPAALSLAGLDLSPGDQRQLIETEPLRRKVGPLPTALDGYELFVPLQASGNLVGTLAIAKRQDGNMYTERALQALRVLGNIVSVALSNARRALEIEKRHRLDRYLPPQVVDTVLDGRHSALEVHQRQDITIFFSDIKDFTEMADRLQPGPLTTVLNEYLSEMAELAFQHGGTLDKFIGDAVMVFFGAPVPMEGRAQAERCLRMAAAMQRRLRALNQRWLREGLLGQDLQIRIGIHAGEAIVGTFGSQARVEYTAIGRSVNLASRLEGQCRPGFILTSKETYLRVSDQFSAVPRGGIAVKGFNQEVEVYELDPAQPAFEVPPLSVEGSEERPGPSAA